MAEQSAHDAVSQTMSVGDFSPSDANEDKSTRPSTAGVDTAAEARTDITEGARSDQDGQTFNTVSPSYPIVNGLGHREPENVQPSPSDAFAQTDSYPQELEFDGNISRNQSLGDLSAASDIDNRKAERSPDDVKVQDASNAARRQASFKPVSFAKYSAVKAAGSSLVAKSTPDKGQSSSLNPSAPLQQGSRPRLVAKATSGLRDNASKSFRSGARNGTGAPDPMQVWNKNRPAPLPSTKHLTDEELKQQYGIHMTSRIEADGENKEAKWADIDDDEDDWAPESIEWADGTKVTLNHGTSIPMPHEVMKLEKLSEEKPDESQPVRPKAPQALSSVGPNATVLRLGASAERQQAQKATILQKGPLEKTTPLAAKSPAPVPVKSPWAPLPPVAKVSPIIINPQVTIPSQNQYPEAPLGNSPLSTGMAPSPAKEISADDFNRSWRDSQSGQPRELYMPSSGRYEAVSESRRRSSRNDQNFRAPALLHRPSPSEQHAPAEPSAAFQTSRISADQERGSWNRRRGSSLQSVGSSHVGPRMLPLKGGDVAQVPSDMHQQNKDSFQGAAADLVPCSRGVHVQQITNLPSTPLTSAPPGQSADIALVAEQKRLMQESARLAVERRRKEEEEEEAAKKERIRLKLEQLGPPPGQKAKDQEQKAESAPKTDDQTAQVSSPPKPPVPEASGEPKQYGLMKVHHPDNVKKLIPVADKPDISVGSKIRDVDASPEPGSVGSSFLIANGVKQAGQDRSDRPPSEPKNDLVPDGETVPSWKNNPAVNEPVSTWSSRNHHPAPASGNLWGPPNHDKALGNGTFDQRLTGLSARDLPVRNNSQQQNWFNGRASSHDKSPQNPTTALPQDILQSAASVASPEQRPIAANSEADPLQTTARPLPICPPQGQAPNQRWQQPPGTRPANNGVAAWNNFHMVAAREDRSEKERFQRDLAASLEEEVRTGRKAPQYTFDETWKQVELGDHAGDRQVTSVAKGNINPSFPGGHPYGAPGSVMKEDRAMNGLPIRGSRFFPAEARRAVTYSHPEVSRSPSPPPAEELGSVHPAYDGDANRPVINFPVPRAVVKLPKPQRKPTPTVAPPAPPAPPRTFAAAAAQPAPPQPSLRAVSQRLASTPSWQHRFNDLFGRKSPPKKQVLAVASSSREPLDVIPANVAAAVSLPPKEVDCLKDAGKVTSKNVEEEEDLFEDREAASTPLVQIPRDIPENILQPPPASPVRPKGRFFRPEIDPVTIPSFSGTDDYGRGLKGKGFFFYIHLPGSPRSTRKALVRKGADEFMSKAPRSYISGKHKKGPPRSGELAANFQSAQYNNKGSKPRTPPAVHGSVPSPRSGFSHNSNNGGWRGAHFASAGVAH